MASQDPFAMQVSAILLGDGEPIHQQCGGFSCFIRCETGRLVEVAGQEVVETLFRYFAGDKWQGGCDDGIDEETAAFIEREAPGFRVDESRYAESMEAWVYGHLDGHPAVLIWENGD